MTLPGTAKDELLLDVQRFLTDEDKEWYATRGTYLRRAYADRPGVPHRRGYLLHGRPGSAKTLLVSTTKDHPDILATAIASQLKLDTLVNPALRG